MGRFEQFLKTASIGPLVLGMSSFDVTELLGEPDQESQKKNPLTLKYGSLQLVFWKHSGQRKSQLREILLSFIPALEGLPPAVALDDFAAPATDKQFVEFAKHIRCMPPQIVNGESGTQFVFLSGVVAQFSKGMLHTMRVTQNEKGETTSTLLSDEREPSREQIIEMIEESERTLDVGANRAALMLAWAAMEATLRRVALLRGIRAEIGVQPSVLIRELLSANVLRPSDARSLEEFRQIRTASAHGLAPVAFDSDIIGQINDTSRWMLIYASPNARKRKEISDVIAVDAVEAYSVIVPTAVSDSLFEFFQSKNFTGRIVRDAIGGPAPQDDIQIDRTITFRHFVRVLNQWKESYVNA